MADRKAGPKRVPRRLDVETAGSAGFAAKLAERDQRLADISAELQDLKKQLLKANRRVAELEAGRRQAMTEIDDVIASLNAFLKP